MTISNLNNDKMTLLTPFIVNAKLFFSTFRISLYVLTISNLVLSLLGLRSFSKEYSKVQISIAALQSLEDLVFNFRPKKINECMIK